MTPTSPARPRRPPKTAVWLAHSLLILLGYAGLGRLSLLLADLSPLVSPFWPAAGLAVAVVFRTGPRHIPAIALGAVLLAWSRGAALWLACAIALGNVGGPWLAARWLDRSGFDPQLARQRDLWLLLGVGAVGAGALSAANGSAWLAIGGHLAVVDLPRAALHWGSGCALGVLVAGVPLLTLRRSDFDAALAAPARLRNLLLLCCLFGTLAALLVAPPISADAAVLLLPVLLTGLVIGPGLGIATAALLVLTMAMLAGSAFGLGPLVAASAPFAMVWLWGHVAMLSVLLLLVHLQFGVLARREERWRLVLEGSELGAAEWNLRTGTTFASPCWHRLMASVDGERGPADRDSLEHWLGHVHSDDRAALIAMLDAAGERSTGAPRREARLRVRGGWRWFDVNLSVAERDRDGRPLRVLGVIADASARRSAEDRQQLFSTVFMQLSEGLAVADADLRVIDANATYSQITGVALGELIGTVPGLLQPNADGALSPQQLAGLWSALRGQGHWVGEVVGRRRNGEACTLHVTVSKVLAPDGALRHHVLVVSDITEQRLQREQLERQANFDELTRLPNRARLGQLLADAMAATDREGYLLAVCYLDLDHFKAVNERHGRVAGDLLLAEVANRLRGALRSRHAVWSDAAARLGGDEFVLLLRAGTVDEARAAVERVLRVVSKPVALVDGQPPAVVTASVGATIYPLDASDADTLMRHADHAMYAVKQSGRNGYLFFDPEHSRRNEQRVLAIGRVQDALDHQELLLYYQPKVDMRRGVVLGVEALLRWNHPEHGVVPPAQFLPLIEHTGLSARVGDHVLAQALDQLEVWQRQGLDLSVSVNISVRHLQEPDFAQRLTELLARHPQPLGPRLELEVLETAALNDISFTSALLDRCARLGVRWALDDFGTGYSTLTYLKRLPVQVLKIDRSFVQNMLTDAQDRAIVEGVISLARTFDCMAVAEGVESAAHARMLLDMGCEVGQGTGIAPPMPAAELAPWVREWRGLFAQPPSPAAAPVTLADAPVPDAGRD